MRLICPNCVAQYEVDENVIPSEGRDVQCANCGHNWFQDAIQMLSADAETTSGTGDPDSDVPPELFNDLEGKLDTEFASARAEVAPDPNDMAPEEPRDDFQIEQQDASSPSSKLDQDALDILRTEAEYSSGEKPPAAIPDTNDSSDVSAQENISEPEEPADDTHILTDNILKEASAETVSDEPVTDTPDTSALEDAPVTEESAAEPVEVESVAEPVEFSGDDDLDEIRRRILDLESQDEIPEQSEPAMEPEAEEPALSAKPETDQPEEITLDDLDIPDVDTSEIDQEIQAAPVRPSHSDNPFSRPPSRDANEVTPSADRQYEENIPVEQDEPSASKEDLTIDDAIESLVAEQEAAEAIVVDQQLQAPLDEPAKRVSARRFPSLDAASDDLYGAPEKQMEARKDMLPDVDELSSEIADEAEQGAHDALRQATKAASTSKGGFLKGFKYGILLCIIIGFLYLFQPAIVKLVPQAEGFLNVITGLVDKAAGLLAPLIEKIKG